jgi:hypothetical protein
MKSVILARQRGLPRVASLRCAIAAASPPRRYQSLCLVIEATRGLTVSLDGLPGPIG